MHSIAPQDVAALVISLLSLLIELLSLLLAYRTFLSTQHRAQQEERLVVEKCKYNDSLLDRGDGGLTAYSDR